VFFSLSDSKLIPYVLPALPAFALLLAVPAPETLGRDAWRTALLTLAAGAALGVLCLLGPKHISPSDRSVYFLALAKPLAEIAALLGATGLYVISRRRRDDTRSWVFLGAGWCLAGLLFVRAASSVAPVYSGFDLARALPNIAVDAPVYSVGTYDQTLPFYWRRTLQLVAYRGELDYGLRHQPGAEMSVVEFVARWTLASEGYAVMEQDMFDDLKSQGVPMREMGRDLHRILVSRR
jgi:4-amino-4-deoxy-L-arabinose transferase-like glycosyltransferase